MRTIDINCDCGESFGNWTLGADAEILPRVTAANVACGFHAGDPVTMRRTIALAEAGGTAVGAHPGLPDLVGFGRRRMAITPEEAHAMVLYQAGALKAMLAARGLPLNHVKPHGALYLMLNEDVALAEAVAEAIRAVCPEPRLYWPAPLEGAALPAAAARAGIDVIPEVYFDLGYGADGRLVLARRTGRVDLAATRAKVRAFLERGVVETADGGEMALAARSICIHGDGPDAAALLAVIREEVASAGLTLAAAA